MVFGIWAMVLVVAMFLLVGGEQAVAYVESRNFTEPMFVFAIMVVAGERARCCRWPAGLVAGDRGRGSRCRWRDGHHHVRRDCCRSSRCSARLITEPAAMTLAALMLRDRLFVAAASRQRGSSTRTLGVLFVNISIGGALTPFAAPPVLMVAARWNWDIAYMLTHVRLADGGLDRRAERPGGRRVHLPPRARRAGTGAFAATQDAGRCRPSRSPSWRSTWCSWPASSRSRTTRRSSSGLFIFFLGFATAYPGFQDRLILREALLVGLLPRGAGRAGRPATVVAGSAAAAAWTRQTVYVGAIGADGRDR